jgi:hypothetical protein
MARAEPGGRGAAAALVLGLLLGPAAPCPAATAPDAEALLQLEIAASRKPDLYLVVDREGTSLAIRARGFTLREVPLQGIAFLFYEPMRGGAAAADVPGGWTVVEEPDATHRRRISPDELRPFPGENGVEQAPSTSQAAELPPPPPTYRVGLDGGWELLVTQQLPGTGWWSRLGRALADGWLRVVRRLPARPNLLVLAASPEDAQRLHHVFREGTRVLLGPAAR